MNIDQEIMSENLAEEYPKLWAKLTPKQRQDKIDDLLYDPDIKAQREAV